MEKSIDAPVQLTVGRDLMFNQYRVDSAIAVTNMTNRFTLPENNNYCS